MKPKKKTDWHGWTDRNGISWNVGRFPTGKAVRLYKMDGLRITSAAVFKNEDIAREFLAFMDLLAARACK